MPKKSSGSLTKFLKRYSTTAAKKHVYKLYREWTLVEVRDAGHKDNLFCPCGQCLLTFLLLFLLSLRCQHFGQQSPQVGVWQERVGEGEEEKIPT